MIMLKELSFSLINKGSNFSGMYSWSLTINLGESLNEIQYSIYIDHVTILSNPLGIQLWFKNKSELYNNKEGNASIITILSSKPSLKQ